MNALTRRARIDRWIASLTPYFDVISLKARSLRLGEPRIEGGPTYLDVDKPGDTLVRPRLPRIRKSVVWFIDGANVGFHVDFYLAGIHIEAWTGKDRHASLWIAGKVSEKSLKKDLTTVLASAGLNDLARTDEFRATFFHGRHRKEQAPLDKA